MGEPRRPITDAERPYLRALGAELRQLRTGARLAQLDLALAVTVSPRAIQYIESGHRRTRSTTLLRISAALVDASKELGPVEDLHARLVALAGDALAPESEFATRIEKRRDRRQRRLRRLLEAGDTREGAWYYSGPPKVCPSCGRPL